MNKTVILLGIFALGSWNFAQAQASAYDALPTENGIAAIVESTIITHEELRKDLAPMVPTLQRKARNQQEFQAMLDDLQQDILMNLIDRVLIRKEFQEKFVSKGYQMPRSFVENKMDDTLINEFNNDRAKFLEYLKSQGLNMREYRQKLQEEIIVQIMLSQQRRTRSILSPAKIETFYNEQRNRFYQEERVHLKLIRLAPYASEKRRSADANRQQDSGRAGKRNGIRRASQKIQPGYPQRSRRRLGLDQPFRHSGRIE